MHEFHPCRTASIKAIGVKEHNKIGPPMRFSTGKMFRDIIFLVIINSKVLERFDVSHEFWEPFDVRKENTRKQLGLYEIEHIEDPCFVTIATNPKEYIEYFKSEYINKKHKGIRKSENSLNLESFAKRRILKSIRN